MTSVAVTMVAVSPGRHAMPGRVLCAFAALLGLAVAGCASGNVASGPQGVADAGLMQEEGPSLSHDGGAFEAAENLPEASGSDDPSSPADSNRMVLGGNDAAMAADTGGAAADADAPAVDAQPRADAEAGARDASLGSTGCAGHLFCEDFERGSLDPAIWSAQANGGQSVGVVETAAVAHGKYAIQFHANPGVLSYSFIITKNAPAALGGHHFGRAYFNITQMPPSMHTEYLFAGTAGFPNLKYLEVASTGSTWQLTFVDRRVMNGLESYAGGGSMPLAHWFCLEWEFNDTPDQATVFVDGQQSFVFNPIAYKGQSTGLVGGFVDFGFGFNAWHPATYPFDVYYDDIVLDTQRVGCLP